MLWIKYSFISFAISFVTLRFIIWISTKTQILSKKPHSERWSKSQVPQIGGVAIFLGFLIPSILKAPFSSQEIVMVSGCIAMFILGLIDDFFSLPAPIKLIIQMSVSCLVCFAGIHMTFTENPFIYYPITILWMVGITNAINLIDNMDGLSSGTCIIILTSILAISIYQNNSIANFIYPLIFSLLAFLYFNFKPAKIFMGDGGSLFLGFFLACISIYETKSSASSLFFSLILPVLLLAVPIFDTLFVSIMRRLNGLPISTGGKDHTSHRMVRLGLDENSSVFILWGLSAFFGLVSFGGLIFQSYLSSVLISLGVLSLLIVGTLTKDLQVYKFEPHQKNNSNLPVNILHKKRLFEIFLDAGAVGLSYPLAYLLRYDFQLNAFYETQITQTISIIFCIKILCFYFSGLYRGIFVYLNFEHAVKVIKANFLGTSVFTLFILGYYRFDGFSRTLIVIEFILCLSFMFGIRTLIRYLKDKILKNTLNTTISTILIAFKKDDLERLIQNLTSKKIDIKDTYSPERLIQTIKDNLDHSLQLQQQNIRQAICLTEEISNKDIYFLKSYFRKKNIIFHEVDPLEESIFKDLKKHHLGT